MEDVLSALQRLNLNLIPQTWVDAVWDVEFTEKLPLDDTIEEEVAAGGPRALRTLFQTLLDWTAEHGGAAAGQSVWAILGDSGVSVKSLVALLSFFVLTGKAKSADVRQRVGGLYAAAVYLLLLGIPGSVANRAFHEVLLDSCSDLSAHCWPQACGKKRKKDVLKSSQTDGKRPRPPRRDAQEAELDEANEEEEEEEEEPHFSGQDLLQIREGVVVLVQSLLRLLEAFPLKERQQTVSTCSQAFAQLLYLEPAVGELSFADVQDVRELSSLPHMAFHGLQRLCSPRHGDPKETLRTVLQQLLYVILMMKKVNRGRPSLLVPSQPVLAARHQALRFVCHLVEELKEPTRPLLHVLLQHLCFQMVEKSEFRSHGAQAVGQLTAHMTNSDYGLFIQWLFSFSRHSKMVHRLFSVDVLMVLLEQPERKPEDGMDPELARFLQHRFLIQDLLFARRADESPTVQGHALSCLAQCLELPSLNVTQAVHSLFCATGTQTVLDSNVTGETLSSLKTYGSLPFRTVELSSAGSSAEDAKENVALLLRRVRDSRTGVRRAALQALLGLLKHAVIPLSQDHLQALWERCRDPAVSVKKKALQCVGELLSARADSGAVQRAWLHGVLPAVADCESSVQDRALEALDQVLLGQVKRRWAGAHLDGGQRLAWDLLSLLSGECQDLSRYFSRAVGIWSKQNRLSQTFVDNLLSHTEAEHAAGAWLLLSRVAASSPTLPFGKIVDAWDAMVSSQEVKTTTCCHILSVVGDIAPHLNEDTKQRLVADLMSWLKTFSLSLELITAAVETLHQLGRCEDVTHTQDFLKRHCGELLSLCEAHLAGILLSADGAQNLDQDLMIKHLHTLGVASLQCPAQVSRRTVLLVESVLTSQRDQLAGSDVELPASQPLSQFRPNALPTRVRAHGVLTLGKLCLQQDQLVQRFLPVLARELEVGPEVAVRNNVVVVLCDLCVRYTNMVDHYIPNVSACLRDGEAVIREQTLIMLTNLLQEEFVKWKGPLFFHFMVTLVDPVPAIARLSEFCLLHLLLKKNPEMFSQHFIECIFYFNSYSRHKTYNRFPQSDRDRTRFSLKGAELRDQRFRIYRFLLQHFTDAQRFNVSSKINQTVLAPFADEELPLDADGADILSETFAILSLKEMKLQAACGPAGGAASEDVEEGGGAPSMAKAVLQAAHKKVVSQVQKKAFVQNTVPLVVSLKALLEQRRSPALRELMSFLQATMQDHRHELRDVLSGDERLAAEVEFALRTAEQQRELQEQMESLAVQPASAQGSPAGRRPLRPFSFATPQPPRPDGPTCRAPLTDWRQRKPQSEEPAAALSKSIPLEGTVITRKTAIDRAISTPKGVNINLTFEEGLSAIFSDQGTSASEESSLLHKRSNQQQTPGLRRWNVQSPLRQKKKPSRV